MSAEQHRNLTHEYATRLEQRFAEGMLAEMQAYPNFVVWRYAEAKYILSITIFLKRHSKI